MKVMEFWLNIYLSSMGYVEATTEEIEYDDSVKDMIVDTAMKKMARKHCNYQLEMDEDSPILNALDKDDVFDIMECSKVKAFKGGKVIGEENLYTTREMVDTDPTFCMGCGLDSTLAAKLYARQVNSKINLVHIDYGACYGQKERKVFQSFQNDPDFKDATFITVDLDVERTAFEDERLIKGYIFPVRNNLLVSIAAYITDASNLYVVGNARKNWDVGARDKGPRFFNEMSLMLSHEAGKAISVQSPFLHLSKKESIHYCIDFLGEEEVKKVMQETTSCYNDGENIECLECYSCFKKYAALSEFIEVPRAVFDTVHFGWHMKREQDKGRELPQLFLDELAKREKMLKDSIEIIG